MTMGLTIEYVMRKLPMIKVAGEGLVREQLSEHDLKMLESVKIPRHLPLTVEEIDGEISFMYRYQGKKNLAVEAARERLDLHQYVAILMEVSSVLKRASDFMLNNEHYVIDPEWMMIGETWEDLYMLYLPVKQWTNQEGAAETIGERLKRFALALMPHVNELKGTKFQKFVAALDQTPFSLDEVISVLQSPPNTEEDPDNFQTTETETMSEIESVEDPLDWEEEVYVPESAQPFPWQAGLKGAIAALLIIGGYLIWKPYVLTPQSDRLFMNSGLTMLLLASGFAAIRWKSWRNDPESEQELELEMEMEQPPIDPPLSPWRSVQQPLDEQPNFETDTILPEDRTVLLQRPDGELNERKPHFKLLRKGHEHEDRSPKEVREIDQQPFIIGRDPKHAHWVIDEAGVSRTHFEVVTEGKECKFRDLGSSNGTFLNQDQVAPYKWYDLHNQDEIEIGQMVFVYGKM